MMDKICKIAIERNEMALKFVPAHITLGYDNPEEKIIFQDHKTAVQNGLSLEFIPEAERTVEICEIAVTKNCSEIQFVPEEKCTAELYKIAVDQNEMAFEFVPLYLRFNFYIRKIIKFARNTIR